MILKKNHRGFPFCGMDFALLKERNLTEKQWGRGNKKAPVSCPVRREIKTKIKEPQRRLLRKNPTKWENRARPALFRPF
jgi:hypothetical protein